MPCHGSVSVSSKPWVPSESAGVAETAAVADNGSLAMVIAASKSTERACSAPDELQWHGRLAQARLCRSEDENRLAMRDPLPMV